MVVEMSEIKEFKYDSLTIDGKIKYNEKYVRVESEIAFLETLMGENRDELKRIRERIKQLEGGRDE